MRHAKTHTLLIVVPAIACVLCLTALPAYAQLQERLTMRGTVFPKSGSIKRVYSGRIRETSSTKPVTGVVNLRNFGLGAGETINPGKLLITVQGGEAGVIITAKGDHTFSWESQNFYSGSDWYWSWQAIEFE